MNPPWVKTVAFAKDSEVFEVEQQPLESLMNDRCFNGGVAGKCLSPYSDVVDIFGEEALEAVVRRFLVFDAIDSDA